MANKKYFPGELEGDGFSKLTQVIAQVGYNREMRIEVGEVTKAPPSLEITLNDGLVLEADDLILAEHLTRHTRIISINYRRGREWDKETEIGDKEFTATSDVAYVGSSSSTTPFSKFDLDYAEIQFEDVLKKGDRVILISDDDTDEYFVIDRAVM